MAQKLHDSTLTKLLHLTTVALMWTSLTKEFTVKSSHIVAVMHTSFNSLKCADNGNICTHLDKLHFKYEELVGISITILTEQYATCIMGSLPVLYQCYLSTIEASACTSALATTAIAATTTNTHPNAMSTFSISPELLMQPAVEEYDRLQAGNTNCNMKAVKEDTGVALSAQSSSVSGNGGKSQLAKNGKPFGVCWNCSGKGHVSSQCPSPSTS